jgi:DNA helicase-2/ATP-dependent DNA helicase PcrA
MVEGMPWLGTFHSIGVKILRRHAELVGLKSGFTILDTDDQMRLIKQLLQAEASTTSAGRAQLAGLIDGWKNRGLTPDKVPRRRSPRFANGKGGKLYAAYQERLKTLNACDFGDLLLQTSRIFQQTGHPDVLRRPTSAASATSWSTSTRTPTSRSISGCGCWRRAQATSAASATTTSRSMAGAAPRSTTSCASRRISRRQGHPAGAQLPLDAAHPGRRLGLIATTRAGSARRCAPRRRGREGLVRGVWDGEEEARAIGDEIEQLQRKGTPLNDIAILVRASFQMREFEERFITLGLPYRVIGGPRFYERAGNPRRHGLSARDRQPDDDLAFERIVNVPKRGLGDTVQARCTLIARTSASRCSRRRARSSRPTS